MRYEEFKKVCRKSLEELYNYLCTDRSKKRKPGRYRIFNESKITFIENILQTKPFWLT